jgi:hypothetical protein
MLDQKKLFKLHLNDEIEQAKILIQQNQLITNPNNLSFDNLYVLKTLHRPISGSTSSLR